MKARVAFKIACVSSTMAGVPFKKDCVVFEKACVLFQKASVSF